MQTLQDKYDTINKKGSIMYKIVLLFLLYVSQLAGAQSDGFRNLKWGDAPTKDMIIILRIVLEISNYTR